MLCIDPVLETFIGHMYVSSVKSTDRLSILLSSNEEDITQDRLTILFNTPTFHIYQKVLISGLYVSLSFYYLKDNHHTVLYRLEGNLDQ